MTNVEKEIAAWEAYQFAKKQLDEAEDIYREAQDKVWTAKITWRNAMFDNHPSGIGKTVQEMEEHISRVMTEDQ